MTLLKALAVPAALFLAGGFCSHLVLPTDHDGWVFLGAFAWAAGLFVGTQALGIVAILALPFVIWSWARGKNREPGAGQRRDRRFAAVFPIAVALWCGAVGTALGFVAGGWAPLDSALLHASAGGVIAWICRWTVVAHYGLQLDADITARAPHSKPRP